MKKPLHINQCEHDIYLGSNDKSDFYLYVERKDSEYLNDSIINICERFGLDGDYRTHMYNPKITNINADDFINKIKEIIWNNQ